LTDPELWERLQQHQLPFLDWKGERVGFTTYVERRLNILPESAAALVMEYRRAVYLASVVDGPVAPPSLVGAVWRFHANAPDYDAKFTHETLRKPVPFVAGVADDAAYFYPSGPYACTLKAYHREFDTEPPQKVWPDPLGNHKRKQRVPETFKISLIVCCSIVLLVAMHTISTSSERLDRIVIVVLVSIFLLLAILYYASLDVGSPLIRRDEVLKNEDNGIY
jgi:hypothetical protein